MATAFEPVLDLTRFHWKRSRGPFTVMGTWMLDEYDRRRPCMVIYRTADEARPEILVPCIVPLDLISLWQEDEDKQHWEPHERAHAVEVVSGTAENFMHALRMDDSASSIERIVRLVQNFMYDLIAMPPYPAEKGEVEADLIIVNKTTGERREIEVRRDV